MTVSSGSNKKDCDVLCAETNCSASIKVLEKVRREGVSTAFQRAKELKPCPFGVDGTCCRMCFMGPCRTTEDEVSRVGVCGATASTVSARNFGRMIAAGTAAHSDHAREVVQALIAVAKGEAPGYKIKDERKLKKVAQEFGIGLDNKDTNQIALELGEKALAEFGKQEGEIVFASRAPLKLQETWRNLGIVPRGIDREVVEMLHRTSVGVDQEYKHIIIQGMRTSLADGWGGSMLATELQDILFGTPVPIRSTVNLGVLKKDEVNIIVHGHEPLLPEVLVIVSRDEKFLKMAKENGAKGINLAGICCTANEVLMRQGVPIAGSVLQQELAIATGAVELMVVDVQCIMQSLSEISKCYHTEIVTTSSKCNMPGATPFDVRPENALQVAEEIVKKAISNFKNRGEVEIPKEKMDLVAGFSHETINYMLGGRYRQSYRPLNDNIMNGRIRGVVGVVGCNNPRVRAGYLHTTLVKELIANDVLVLTTGCAAITCAKEGLLVPEAAELAGSGLREVCEAVGIPPVLHMGSCVDNSRILVAAANMVFEGGLGDSPSELPVAGCAPEWMSEKAIAIGHYFVSSGVLVVFGNAFPTTGSEILSTFLFKGIEALAGGRWEYEPDPLEMAKIMVEHIDEKRKALGIHKEKERVLYDMAMRRELSV